MFSSRLGCIRTLRTSEGWLKQAVALYTVSGYWGLVHWCQYLQGQAVPLDKTDYPLQAPGREPEIAPEPAPAPAAPRAPEPEPVAPTPPPGLDGPPDIDLPEVQREALGEEDAPPELDF